MLADARGADQAALEPIHPFITGMLYLTPVGTPRQDMYCRRHTLTRGCKVQVPVPPLSWGTIYKDAGRPLAVDVGCGEHERLLGSSRPHPPLRFSHLGSPHPCLQYQCQSVLTYSTQCMQGLAASLWHWQPNCRRTTSLASISEERYSTCLLYTQAYQSAVPIQVVRCQHAQWCVNLTATPANVTCRQVLAFLLCCPPESPPSTASARPDQTCHPRHECIRRRRRRFFFYT